MRVLVTCSWITVACALLISVWTVPQYVTRGMVDIGGSPLFEPLFVFPGLIGVPVSLLAGAVAVALLVRGAVSRLPRRLMAWGQLLTVVLIVLCGITLSLPHATGWELLLMPGALQVGQIVVAAGLVLHVRERRRGRRR